MNNSVIILWQLLAITAVILGTFFSVVGVVGLIRLPDVYTRLQATGKVGVLGVALLLLATPAQVAGGSGRALILILLLLITGPAISHAISSAAFRFGIPMKGAIRDDLTHDAEKITQSEE
jgi:multicomponent Na+:H+ antiporter subunit G